MNIGVVITTFNSEDTIKECINSLISKKVDIRRYALVNLAVYRGYVNRIFYKLDIRVLRGRINHEQAWFDL